VRARRGGTGAAHRRYDGTREAAGLHGRNIRIAPRLNEAKHSRKSSLAYWSRRPGGGVISSKPRRR